MKINPLDTSLLNSIDSIFNTRDDIDLSLNRMISSLSIMGDPHLYMPPVIHIAGTNGKGSVAAFLSSILQAHGYRVHCYTSPHLINFNERVRIAGETIKNSYLNELLFEVQYKCSSINFTYFELSTMVAFLAFSRESADITIIETGLGGRLDATNVIPNPLGCIITPISYDHMNYLGNTLAEIAKEKAGIIKREVPVIIGKQETSVKHLLLELSSTLTTDIYNYSDNWTTEITDEGFYYNSDESHYELSLPALYGKHQVDNAALAIATLEKLELLSNDCSAIENGLKNTNIAGRMQNISSGMLFDGLPDGYRLILDGAHNSHAASTIAETLRELEPCRIIIIFGMLRDREPEDFISHFDAVANKVFCVPISNQPGWKCHELVLKVKSKGLDAYAAKSIVDCIELIAQEPSEDTYILVTGSLYLVGEALLLNNEENHKLVFSNYPNTK